MPKEFDNCVQAGGRVRTKTLKENKYMHICYKDGKSYTGEIKKGKSNLAKNLIKRKGRYI